MAPEDASWVVFDGHCILCNRFVQIILANERTPELQFATTRSPTGRRLASQHGLTEGDLDRTYLFVSGGKAWTRSDAWIEIMGHMRPPLRWLRWMRAVPRPWRDAAYNFVARNRYRWFGRHATCPVPPPATRHRFELD